MVRGYDPEELQKFVPFVAVTKIVAGPLVNQSMVTMLSPCPEDTIPLPTGVMVQA